MLLILGVVLFAEVSRAFGGLDDSRIAAQIVTGVGFLGAGTILRHGLEVKGLTSAASLWATAAIGMAVATGGAFFAVSIVGALLTMVTLSWVTKIEGVRIVATEPVLIAQLEVKGEKQKVMAGVGAVEGIKASNWIEG